MEDRTVTLLFNKVLLILKNGSPIFIPISLASSEREIIQPSLFERTTTGFPITVGGGGTAGPATNLPGGRGNPSVFSTITSTGGGGTNNNGSPSCGTGKPGGSGGGAGGTGLTTRCAGAGNTPPVSPPQGNNGGTYTGSGAPFYATAGGGGAKTMKNVSLERFTRAHARSMTLIWTAHS